MALPPWLIRTKDQFGRVDFPGLAAQLAYFFILSLFPSLILLVGLLDALPFPEETLAQVRQHLQAALPGPAGQLVGEYLQSFAHRRPSGALWIWLPPTLWLASRALARARLALNLAMHLPPKRGALASRLTAFVATSLALLIAAAAYLALVAGPSFGNEIAAWFGLETLVGRLWQGLRWPIALTSQTAFLVMLYRYLPSRGLPWRFLWAGAVPVVLGWSLVGVGLQIWIRRVARFDQLYGSLASGMILLVVLYLLSLFLLLGAALAGSLAPPSNPDPESDSRNA